MKKLTLMIVDFKDSDLTEIVRKCSKLEEIRFAFNSEITGKVFDEMPEGCLQHLLSVSFRMCEKVSLNLKS